MTLRSLTVSPVDDEDLVFKALADPTRRLLLDRLFEHDGMTLGETGGGSPHPHPVWGHEAPERPGTSRPRSHAQKGRHKHHYLNPVPIRLIYERWIDKYRDRRAAALLDLKDQLEGKK